MAVHQEGAGKGTYLVAGEVDSAPLSALAGLYVFGWLLEEHFVDNHSPVG